VKTRTWILLLVLMFVAGYAAGHFSTKSKFLLLLEQPCENPALSGDQRWRCMGMRQA
jgi:uncharacterized protein YneF (UPF0154 family)